MIEKLMEEILGIDLDTNVNVMAPYDVCNVVITELMLNGCHLEGIELFDDGDPYVVTLDEENGIWCVSAEIDYMYLLNKEDVNFVYGKLNHKYVKHLDLNDYILFDEDYFELDECNEDMSCEECCPCHDCIHIEEDEDEEIPGFTMYSDKDGYHSSYSFYSSDKELVNNMLDFVKHMM